MELFFCKSSIEEEKWLCIFAYFKTWHEFLEYIFYITIVVRPPKVNYMDADVVGKDVSY